MVQNREEDQSRIGKLQRENGMVKRKERWAESKVYHVIQAER
jgi:hypothetical protein